MLGGVAGHKPGCGSAVTAPGHHRGVPLVEELGRLGGISYTDPAHEIRGVVEIFVALRGVSSNGKSDILGVDT